MPKPLIKFYRRSPTEFLFSQSYIRLTLFGIIVRQRLKYNLRFRTGHCDYLLRQFKDRKFIRVSKIYRSGKVIIRIIPSIKSSTY